MKLVWHSRSRTFDKAETFFFKPKLLEQKRKMAPVSMLLIYGFGYSNNIIVYAQ